jgi:hypothetical protein
VLNERLLRALEQVAPGQPSALHFVQCSSALPTGALILHGFVARENTARLVVKTARNPALPHSLQREWESLSTVRRDAALAHVTPEGIAAFDVDGARFFAYSGVPGRTMSTVLRNRLWLPRPTLLKRFASRALQVALLVHRPASRLVPAASVAEDLLVDLGELRRLAPSLPPSINSKALKAADSLAAAPDPLPRGRLHGDLSPHNLMVEDSAARGTTRIIDWEHMEVDRPQHLDIFRFIGATLLVGKRGSERDTALRSMIGGAGPLIGNLLHPWLDAMGTVAAAWTRSERLEALWWHYWIHATRRNLERLASTDARDSLLLRSVIKAAGP